MEIAEIKNNSYVNSYYSNKADKINKEVGKDGMQQEQSDKKEEGNYDKNEGIQDTIKYEDRFVSPSNLIAISKQSRTKESEDVQNFLHAGQRGIKVELFVRKNKDDKISKEFYYLGRMKATGQVREFVLANTNKTAVEIEWVLDTPVRKDIYDYIVKG